MKKAYLLVYSDALATREQMKECINKLNVVITWRYDMPNCFYLISENNANDISKAIRITFPKGRFIITEITSNKQGFLPKETWYLINEKTHLK